MREGREADGLLRCEKTELSAGRPGIMQQQSLQMTPRETGVITHDTNFSARTLQSEPDSHLHCQMERLLLKNGAFIVI